MYSFPINAFYEGILGQAWKTVHPWFKFQEKNILYTKKFNKLPFIEEVMKLVNTRNWRYQIKKIYVIIINSEEKKLHSSCVALHLFFLPCAFRLPAMTIVQQRSNGCNQLGWNKEDLVIQLSKMIYYINFLAFKKQSSLIIHVHIGFLLKEKKDRM